MPGPDVNHPYDDLTFDNTPNRLTLSRIAFVPIVVGLLFLRTPKWDIVASLCFGLAAITDYFDGYIARKRKIVTVYGQLLDPLADKFLVVCSLIMLEALGRIPAVVVMLLICREMAITGLRALASAEGVVIPASPSAKWKTATQMVAIPFLMVNPGIFGIPLFMIGQALLYLSLAISLWSAKDYVVDFFRGAREMRKQRVEKRKLARELKQKVRARRRAKRRGLFKLPPSSTSAPGDVRDPK